MIGDVVCDTSSLAVHEAIASKFLSETMTHTLYSALSMQCPAVSNAWQYGTDCSGQILFNSLGHTAVARSHGGLSADQVVVQSGTHLWAGFIAIPGKIGEAGKFVGTLFSDPVEVGTFEVNDGVAIIDFVVPNVPAGEHHLELRGDDGSVYRLPILVTETQVTDGPLGYVVDGSTVHVPSGSGTGSVGSSGSIFGS